MSERKYKYGEPTQLVSGFRVPVSKVEVFREKAYEVLDSWIVSGRVFESRSIESEEIDINEEAIISENIEDDVNWVDCGIVVTTLPKERKMVIDGGLKGLYSAGNKWYTNKIVDNELVILEWDKLDYAKKYLQSLIK